jgi:GDP-L-fucose synthase
MCQSYHKQYECNFISAMPTNLYGPGDNYDLKNSHVLPALLRKFHEAKLNGAPTVTVWGTGKPRREFLHADDLADACLFLMDHYNSPEIINIGVGKDISIGEMAQMIKNITGYEGEIVFDSSMPDGTFRKLLDVRKLNGLGWEAKIGFEEGVEATYQERFGVEV